MAGEVITTGTRAADAARADARQGTDPSTQDAEHAEAAVAADVPESRALNGTTGTGTTRAQRSRVLAAQSQPPADAAVPGVGVRRRLARLGAAGTLARCARVAPGVPRSGRASAGVPLSTRDSGTSAATAASACSASWAGGSVPRGASARAASAALVPVVITSPATRAPSHPPSN